jgi:hypothetical protein
MLSYLFGVIVNNCCFGKPTSRERKLIDRLLDDVKELTTEELCLLRSRMIGGREKSYCC